MIIEPTLLEQQPYDETEYEDHEVPFGALHVNAFASETLCEAIKCWWRPSHQQRQQDPVDEARDVLDHHLRSPDYDGFLQSLHKYRGDGAEAQEAKQQLIASVERARERMLDAVRLLDEVRALGEEGEAEEAFDEQQEISMAAERGTRESIEDLEDEGELIVVPHSRNRDPNKPVSLFELLYMVRTKGESMLWDPSGQPNQPGVPIKVRIVLSYPLHHEWEYIATIPATEFGSVFEIGYQMYKHIYALDDSAWSKSGHDEVPRVAPHMANRARGEYVWGHDMSDLVFEGLMFKPEPGVEPVVPGTAHEREPQLVGTVRFVIGS